MPSFDCQLDHHPLIRLDAADAAAAKTEYFRLYSLVESAAEWHCKSAEGPAPVEPEAWVKRRKELGTFVEPAKPVAPKPVPAEPPRDADK